MTPVKDLLKFIKSSGYTSTKDVLGTYFDREGKRFSIMRQGTWYMCYYNIKDGANWSLQDKSDLLEDFKRALIWVVEKLKEYD